MANVIIKKMLISIYFVFILVTIGFAGIIVFDGVVDDGSVVGTTTRYVGGSGLGNYSKIQDAIDNATAGDTIRVYAGTYYENVIVNKTVTLIGNGTTNTIINGSGKDDGIHILADWVNVSGFTICQANKGVNINGASNVTVENCNINNCTQGIKITSPFFQDDFDTGTWDNSKWTRSNPYAGISSHTSKSGSYSMYTHCRDVTVTSKVFNTSLFSRVEVGFWIRRGSGIFSDKPMWGDDLIIEYYNSTGFWKQIVKYYGSGLAGQIYNPLYNLSNDAIHSKFRLRFRQTNGGGLNQDYWHIDDIIITDYLTDNQSENNLIRNNICSNNIRGIYICSSSNNKIDNNTCNLNDDGIFLWDSSSITLANNTCNLNKAEGINLNSSISNTLANNTLSNNDCYGIQFYSSGSNKLINNTISDNGWDGLRLYSSTSNTLINNNASKNNKSGFKLFNSNSNTLANNTGQSNKESGFKLFNSFNNMLNNNIAHNNQNYGLELVNSNVNMLINNTALNNNESGLKLFNSNSNTLANNTAQSNKESGFKLYNSYNNMLNNNIAHNNQNSGLELANSHSNTQANNIALNNNESGLKLTSSCSNTITNNNVSDNDYGIYLWDSRNNLLSNNYCTNNTDGIKLNYSSDNIMNNNTCNFNSFDGISNYHSSFNIISNNYCNSNNNGIYISSSKLITMRNNTCNFNDNNGLNLYKINLDVSINQSDEIIFYDNFSTDKGWTGYGKAEWERGPAQSGARDPANDHTPTSDKYIIGNDIGGAYSNGISKTFWLTSPSINCLGWTNIHFEFYRWLEIENSFWDKAYIGVYNGVKWKYIWSHSGENYIWDKQWKLISFNVSAYADNNPAFRIRFGLGPTDSSNSYAGWSIDDVQITGFLSKPEVYHFRNNTYNSNLNDGIRIYNSNQISLLENNLNNNNLGVNITSGSSNCSIINTSVMNSTAFDIRFTNDSHATALNCTLNWFNINYADSASNLTVKWFMHVNVTNETGVPVPLASVVVIDNFTNQIYNSNTNPTGYCKWIICNEYIENSTGIIKNFSPYNITASKTPYEEGYAYPEPVMNTSNIINIVLYPDITPPDPPTYLVFDKIGGTFLNMSWNESNSHDVYGYIININDTGSNSTFHFLYSTENCYFNATNLLEEVTYYFVIIAFDDVPWNSSNLTGYNTTIDITPPEPPTSILFTDIGRWYLNISWTPSISADVVGYQIFINDTGTNTSFHFFANTSNSYFNCTGLLEDTKYYFKIRAYDEVSLFSVFSDNISSPTLDLTPPQPPSLLIFTENGGIFLNLSWTSSNSTDVEGYNIYINDTGSNISFHLLGATQNTFYNATGLLEETIYFFEIKAYDEVPWESSALTGNNTTIDITLPNAPTNLAIFRLGHNFINITWTASTSPDVQGYEIYLNDTGSATNFHLLNTTQNTYYNYTGLQEETTCYFKIRAFDEVSYFSDFSSIVSGTTMDITPPSAPTSLICSKIGGRFIRLSWSASISIDVKGYEIYINDTGSNVNYHYSTKTTNNYFNHTGLAEETTYYFQIRTFDEVPLFSGFSNVVFATTFDVSPPIAPTSLTFLKVGGTYLNISWNGSISKDVEGYKIYINDTSSLFSFNYLITTTECYFNYTGLPEETKYYFKILAFDEIPLFSAFSNVASTTTLDITAPKPPTGLTAQNPKVDRITLTWNPNPEPDIVGYNIYINETETGSFMEFRRIDTMIINFQEFTIINLVEKTTYYFVITAFDEVPNYSTYSNVAIVTTLDKTPPIAPIGLKAIAISGTNITLNWDSNPEQDLAGYNIYINDTNNNPTGTFHIIHTSYGSHTSYTVTNLSEKTTYYFKLKAFDEVPNISPFSKVAFATTLDETPPSKSTGLRVSNPNVNNLTISWSANLESDILGYKLYRSLSPNEQFNSINTLPITETHYLDTNLDDNTTYYYKLKAIDTVDLESLFSEIAFGTTKIGPHPPEIRYHLADFVILEDSYDDTTINLYQWFKDVNNDTLMFRYEGANNITVEIFEENGTVILRSKYDWCGKETITFYANDGIFDEIFNNVTITIEPVNDPPRLPAIVKPKDGIRANKFKTLDFEGRCYDPDLEYGDELTFTWYSSINGELGEGITLENIHLDVGEHLITLNVTDTYGETSNAVIKVIVQESSDRKENQYYSAIIISLTSIFIMICVILFLFVHFKKEKIQKTVVRQKKEIIPTIDNQLQTAHILPSSPSSTYPLIKKRPQNLPAFTCPNCSNVIYERDKCLNCGWMGK